MMSSDSDLSDLPLISTQGIAIIIMHIHVYSVESSLNNSLKYGRKIDNSIAESMCVIQR